MCAAHGRRSFSDKTPFDKLAKGYQPLSNVKKFFCVERQKKLAHSRWNCKYHIVFIVKYRRKVIYGQLRKKIGKILRKLCYMKEVEINEVYVMPDHIHRLAGIPSKMSVSSFIVFLKGSSVVIIHEDKANFKYNYSNQSFWEKVYYVSTLGLNQKKIVKYIREQEAEERLRNSISKGEYND